MASPSVFYFILLPESTELSYAQTEDVVKIAKTKAASIVVFITFSQILNFMIDSFLRNLFVIIN